MSEPIRVLHFADIHIGMENYGKTHPETGLSSRVVDFLRRMDEMIDHAREHDVDLVVFAGDAFKTRTPNPTYQREFAYRVQDLAELAPVMLLVGNHDLPPNYLRASSVEIYHTLNVPNVLVADEYELHIVETKRGPVAVGAAPYPVRSRLLQDANTGGLTVKQIDELQEQVMLEKIEALAVEAAALDMPRLLTGHFTVGGARVGSERSIMVGRDASVPLSALADDRWDYVALGHIHKHQNLTQRREGVPPVVYSGSMERIDFGEESDTKGFCWVELARGATSWDFVRVSARPFVTLRADLRRSDDPTPEMVAMIRSYDLREAVVRVLVSLTTETHARFSDAAVRNELQQAGVFSIAGISKDVEQEARMRLGDSPEGLTPLELLERYLQTRSVSANRRDKLLEAARTIIAED